MEGDEEIQDLLKASTGLNLALTYLPEAITFDPIINKVDPLLASKIVWLDSLILNVDRTSRNTNMLTWKGDLWLIDHGASLYFHHNWEAFNGGARPFPQIKKHVLPFEGYEAYGSKYGFQKDTEQKNIRRHCKSDSR